MFLRGFSLLTASAAALIAATLLRWRFARSSTFPIGVCTANQLRPTTGRSAIKVHGVVGRFLHQANANKLVGINAVALVAVAVFARCYALGHLPGVNGDEAWYGVRAWSLLHGDAWSDWHTPTGNPLNPFFVGPLVLFHLWGSPSFVLLRSAAVVVGIAALAINGFLCRWVFDGRTAAVSTVLLAIAPINIAYSRLAWDASQSLAATLLVVYLALASLRFPRRFGLCIAAALLAQAIAVWVHPTNLFAGAFIVAACALRYGKSRRPAKESPDANVPCPEDISWVRRHAVAFLLVAAGLALIVWFMLAIAGETSLVDRLAQRMAGGHQQPLPSVTVLFARLFTGGTVYRYVAGSRSWWEWPLPPHLEGAGLDVFLFWFAMLGAMWLLWRSRIEDRLLLAGSGLMIVVFGGVAGPSAMMPGQERFAICLVGPTLLVLARGGVLAWAQAFRWRRGALIAVLLAGWLVLADFHAHYFRFLERTGGRAHMTFRTAAVEPKQAALRSIESSGQKAAWIVCSQWWNYWPIAYLALPNRNVHVWMRSSEAIGCPVELRDACEAGRVFIVEFSGSAELREWRRRLNEYEVGCQEIPGFDGNPILSVLRVGPQRPQKRQNHRVGPPEGKNDTPPQISS